MKSFVPRSFLERFTFVLTVWTGLIYALLLALRFSRRMVPHETLQAIVFGPALILLVVLAAYELHIHRRH